MTYLITIFGLGLILGSVFILSNPVKNHWHKWSRVPKGQ
jgi:hypothetical protein